jgi:hypothetical protein
MEEIVGGTVLLNYEDDAFDLWGELGDGAEGGCEEDERKNPGFHSEGS